MAVLSPVSAASLALEYFNSHTVIEAPARLELADALLSAVCFSKAGLATEAVSRPPHSAVSRHLLSNIHTGHYAASLWLIERANLISDF